jgi:hypothetical protein
LTTAATRNGRRGRYAICATDVQVAVDERRSVWDEAATYRKIECALVFRKVRKALGWKVARETARKCAVSDSVGTEGRNVDVYGRP